MTAANLFLLLSVSFFSFHAFSGDEVYRLHYPCPGVVKKAPQITESVYEQQCDFHGHPQISTTTTPLNLEDENLNLNIPWDDFLAHANKLLYADDAKICDVEELIFTNLITIQKIHNHRYRRFRKLLYQSGRPLANVFLANLTITRRKEKQERTR